jgi:hypothetical protein
MAHCGSVFDFYNRVDRPEWARVRDELEDWYSHYPDDDGELRKRFRSRRHDQHFGAWWELYTYTFYRRLEYEITVHPTLPNGEETKPRLHCGASATCNDDPGVSRGSPRLADGGGYPLGTDPSDRRSSIPLPPRIADRSNLFALGNCGYSASGCGNSAQSSQC